jgi:HTH-type transcriptional regulator, transcriptional repressor of NAD biosynthesis genes
MKPSRLGLVIGKFAPLHKGHERVFEHAASQCRSVLVLSWSQPELSGCEAERRRRWLGLRFPAATVQVVDDAWLDATCAALRLLRRPIPDNKASDDEQQAFLAWMLRDVLDEAPDAMFASEPYLWPCARRLSESLGRPVAAHMVDLGRREVPVSGTAIRADPHGMRQFMAPEVYADFVERIVVLGGESSGKTTLAEALAARLGTAHVTEYGREHWVRRSGQLDRDDLIAIAEEQRRREDDARVRCVRYLVCDTDALTTLGYGVWMFGERIHSLAAEASRLPRLAVLCEPDFPFEQDGTRRDASFRARQHRWYVDELQRRGGPWMRVRGSVDARVGQILDRLGVPADPAS